MCKIREEYYLYPILETTEIICKGIEKALLDHEEHSINASCSFLVCYPREARGKSCSHLSLIISSGVKRVEAISEAFQLWVEQTGAKEHTQHLLRLNRTPDGKICDC